MVVNRRRRRRTVTVATALAGVALAAGFVTGCDPDDVDHSLGCVRGYDTVADSLRAIHEAGSAAASDPSRTGESIDTVQKNLDRIGDDTGDSKVDKAVKDLDRALADYNRAVLAGENPDSRAIDEAADELKDVCAS
ncbi:hypothetical protein [Streptomyces gilvus]|uniref:hypothetical protein n=1 Tax=Streptomyces gilvus TaxID=2920937 RepID=UPI001F0E0C64|nr:hypothetical protein [Streptomyces sp. CME 23]MCH5674425.1 hypothetical protein [Streptomyces sp. CME 23]